MKEQYHLVSFSGGKDSTAMLLGMLERDMKIDCILFCDTGLEFPAMYDHIAKVEKDIGRKITSVRAEHTYEELMFDVPVRRSADSPVVRQYGAQLNGYGWPGPRQRWCTTRLKAMRGFSAFLYARSTSAPAILSATLSGWQGFTFSNMVLPLSCTEQAFHKVVLRR